MSGNKLVVRFVFVSFSILFLYSLCNFFYHTPFNKINILSDVVTVSKKVIDSKSINTEIETKIEVDVKDKKDFYLYKKAKLITDFNADTSSSSLSLLVQKLRDNLTGKQKRKIRVAYFGDSMIEGDLITQTLRKLLQKQFGGTGVGFVPVTSVTAQYRQTATTNSSPSWIDESFKDKKRNLYLSGHVFASNAGKISIKDNLRNDSTALIEKSLICGYTNHKVPVVYNGSSLLLNPENKVNRILLSKDLNHKIELMINDESLPVYGVSFESESGVIVDNFSFRGITGIELATIDTSMLSAIAKANDYDLIVFQYGVNLLFRPNDLNYNWYYKTFAPVIKNFKSIFPHSSFMIVSTADRAFRYDGEWKSAIGIDSLVKTQAKLAFETGITFYNQYESMGGKNSIVEWANQSPSLANKDYIHPNQRGAEILANYLFEALLNDYKKQKEN